MIIWTEVASESGFVLGLLEDFAPVPADGLAPVAVAELSVAGDVVVLA